MTWDRAPHIAHDVCYYVCAGEGPAWVTEGVTMYATYLCKWRFGWARKALLTDEPQRVIETAEEALALWSALMVDS